MTVLNLLPYRIAMAMAGCIGFLAFSVVRIRRSVTLDNLKKSFGDTYTDNEYIGIGARTYRNIARGFVEYGLFPSLSKKNLSRFLSIEGEENL